MFRRSVNKIAAAVAYLLMALLFTFPLVFNISSMMVGVEEDNYQFLWNMWWMKRSLFREDLLHTDMLFYSHGADLTYHSLTYYNSIISIALQPFFPLPVIYNLLSIQILVLSAFFTYLLVLELTQETKSAFLAGAFFGFSPYLLMKLSHHLNIASVQFIPLTLLMMLRISKNPRFSNAVYLSLSFLLVTLCDWHHGLITGLFMLLFFLFQFYRERSFYIIKYLAFSCLIFVVLIAPFAFPLLKGLNSFDELQMGGYDYNKLDLLSIAVPSYDQSIWGRFFRPLYERFEGNDWENVAFIGIVPGILLVLYVYKKKYPDIWISMFIVFYVLSLGSHLGVFGHSVLNLKGQTMSTLWFSDHLPDISLRIPLPFMLIQNLPFFSIIRTPNRFVIIAYLMAAVMLAYSVKEICQGKRYLHWLLLFLIIFEFIAIPFPLSRIEVPEAYSSLGMGSQPIIEFPSDNYKSDAKYMFYQTYHERPILSGYASRSGETEKWLSLAINRTLLSEPDAFRKYVGELNVSHILVHKNLLTLDEQFAAEESLKGLEKTSYGDIDVYRT